MQTNSNPGSTTHIRRNVGRLICASVAIFLLGHSACVVAQTTNVSLFDGDFNPTDWTQQRVDAYSDRGFDVKLMSSGGNPGNWRELLIPVGQDGPLIINISTALAYTPSLSGSIQSLDFSADMGTTNGAGADYYLLLSQGGTAFIDWTATMHASGGLWQHRTLTGLTASNFVRLDGAPGQPDFSVEGGLIDFGYATGAGGGGYFTSITGIDNYSASLTVLAPQDVPEPETAALVGMGVVGMALAGRFRRSTGKA